MTQHFGLRRLSMLLVGMTLFWVIFVLLRKTVVSSNGIHTRSWIRDNYLFRAIAPCDLCDSNHKKKIPKIIHQIWSDEVLPSALVDNVRDLVGNHPDWEYYFWTDEAGQKLIEDRYSFLLDIYKADHIPLHAGLFRSDILRYVVLHEFGGVYFDLDTVSLRPLDKFIETTECSFVVEPAEHYFFFNVDIILSNAAMMCVPAHAFLKQILHHVMKLNNSCLSQMHCSGPLLVTDIYKELNKSGNILAKLPDVQSSELFMDVYDHPLQGARLERVCRNLTALNSDRRAICKNWIARGKSARSVSDKAYTYHRWYHLKYHKIRFSLENNITQLVPQVKLYGTRNFERIKKKL